MTSYVILCKTVEDWEELAKRVEASSAKAALRTALKGTSINGEYVAIPLRSWHPLKVTVETQQRLKFS